MWCRPRDPNGLHRLATFLPRERGDEVASTDLECQGRFRNANVLTVANCRVRNPRTSGRLLGDSACHDRASLLRQGHFLQKISAVPPPIAVMPPALLKRRLLPNAPLLP